MSENLRLLFSLYWRPRRTMGRILDEGSLLFGAAAVLVVSLLLVLAFFLPLWATVEAQTPEAVTSPGPPTAKPVSPPTGLLEDTAAGGGQAGGVRALLAQALFGSMLTSVFFALLSIAFLYIPACVLAATLLAPVGSFGVAFRRDYGALLACALFSWAAALCPFALANLAAPGLPLSYRFLLFLGGIVGFLFFMAVAASTVFGVGTKVGLGVALLGGFGLLLAPLGPFLASPFLLYIVFQLVRGDIADVRAIFGRRRSFKRHLHAATLNPRDAEAHYQLGLLHLQRRELEEAKARFQKAVEIDSRELDAHYQLGRLAREEGRFEDAIRHFEEVVRQDETHSRHEVWREIGATYVASTSWPSARWALEKFTAKRPHDPEGLVLFGRALLALGEKDLAQDAFRRCIESVDTMPAFRRAEVGRFKKEARKLLAAL
jgi:tetratricopeptide (TPR) repeat protein